jgi:organic hydroperoxide reductase OsmC/OhrA
MATFETELSWQREKRGRLSARDNPALPVATPPAFGGPERTWCPEELFVASIESCLMSTFLYFAERFGLSLSAYASRSRGVLDKTPEGLRFSAVEVNVRAVWGDDESLQKAEALRMKEKLEKYCPVSASLKCPVVLEVEMRAGAAE